MLSKQATVFLEIGDPERAATTARLVMALINAEDEPRLLLISYHNLVIYLCESERYAEAERLLPLVEAHQQTTGVRADHVRLTWLRGKIAYGLKRYDEAETHLLAAQHRFIETDDVCNAAVVSLDLAACYLEQNRGKAMVRLANDILPIFQSRSIHREALAALELFRRGLETNRLTQDLIAKLRLYFRQARHDPEMRFMIEADASGGWRQPAPGKRSG